MYEVERIGCHTIEIHGVMAGKTMCISEQFIEAIERLKADIEGNIETPDIDEVYFYQAEEDIEIVNEFIIRFNTK